MNTLHKTENGLKGEGYDTLAKSLHGEGNGRKRVVVVGGGASGLMAAYASAKNGNETVLIEKNEKLGKKIYITGKGRCNLTNDCTPDVFLQNVVHGGKFLTGAAYAFPAARTMSFMEEFGLTLKVERGNRVFPLSDHASDVTKTLEHACRSVGVKILLNTKAEKIVTENGSVSGIRTGSGFFSCDKVIVATGGISYPATGSTGDGYRFAEEVGHSIVSPVPSLVGLELKEDLSSAQGITLKNVVLTAKRAGKVISSRMGELLVTHYGISGPLVLSLSAEINRFPLREVSLILDLKPALSGKELDARLLRDFGERKNETLKNVMRGLLPGGFGSCLLRLAEISGEVRANSVTRQMREKLVCFLKTLPLNVKSMRGFDEAVVTSGGVSLKEIDPKTMESKIVKGLSFCGEVLDLDAYTGGFNLQIAFSTGFIAGNSP